MSEIVLAVCLSACVLLIVFMFFYIKWMIKTISSLDETLVNLWKNLSDFNDHLNKVHNTEMFYGDSTLEALIKHSQELSENIESARGFFLPEEGIEDAEEKKE